MKGDNSAWWSVTCDWACQRTIIIIIIILGISRVEGVV